jgi:hypothetical protein
MVELASIAEDLAFVRKRVVRTSHPGFPASILFLWAGIVLAGSILTDVAHEAAGLYWLLAGPSGGIASAFLGRRWARIRGHGDHQEGITQALHWGGLLVTLFTSALLILAGALSGQAFGAQALLLVSLAYYYAGLHMHRSLLWLAGLQFVVYLVVVLAPGLPQTVTGLFTAAGFIWVGVVTRRASPSGHTLRLEQ